MKKLIIIAIALLVVSPALALDEFNELFRFYRERTAIERVISEIENDPEPSVSINSGTSWFHCETKSEVIEIKKLLKQFADKRTAEMKKRKELIN